ncbi:MAG: tetratricopeptide repeat protein [Lachnospiraceae bacterium]|nr:tetratricopeptide repeat protein [Lachnospiraceae bacterium]
MAFEIQEFYKELDSHYRSLDNDKTRAFLQKMADETRGLYGSGIMRTSCPFCVESPECNYEYVTVCNEYACFLRNISELDESLVYFNEALLELEQHYQTKNANYATIRMNMAGTYRLMGKYDEAIELFKKSEKFFLDFGEAEKYSYVMAGIYNNLSLVYQDMQDYDQAAAYDIEALRYLPGHKDIQRATTLNNLACIYIKQGQIDNAEEAINQSIDILKDIDGGMNFHYPASLNTLGTVLYKKGLPEAALEAFLTALNKTEAIYGKNIDYVNCCNNISRVYADMGDQKSADSYTRMAGEISG